MLFIDTKKEDLQLFVIINGMHHTELCKMVYKKKALFVKKKAIALIHIHGH